MPVCSVPRRACPKLLCYLSFSIEILVVRPVAQLLQPNGIVPLQNAYAKLCVLCSVFIFLISIGVPTERAVNLLKVLKSGMFGMQDYKFCPFLRAAISFTKWFMLVKFSFSHSQSKFIFFSPSSCCFTHLGHRSQCILRPSYDLKLAASQNAYNIQCFLCK